MSYLKKAIAQGIDASTQTRNVSEIEEKTGNIYNSLNIISLRSRQISRNLKEELHNKLTEFAPTNDNLEEVFENREQIEISRSYEKLPNPVLLSMDEFMNDRIYHRNKDEEESKN